MESVDETQDEMCFHGKVKIFSEDYLKGCLYLLNNNTQDPKKYPLTKKFYSEMRASSQLLEDFLDFHGAKNNSDWYFYRELSAVVRHISRASYSQKHILNRLLFYDIPDNKEFKNEEFKNEGLKTLDFLTQCLRNIAPVIIDEAKRLDIELPAHTNEDFPSIASCNMLEYDIDEEDRDQQKKIIIKIANEFLKIAESFDENTFYNPYGLDKIKQIVPDKINEVEIRRFEMLVHSLQSSFDTYVIYGGYRVGNKKLKQFRGYFSVIFHLLQMIGRLLHFYERHLHEAGYKNIIKKIHNKLLTLIDPDVMLDRIVNYGVFYVGHFFNDGKELAKNILDENIERKSITVNIPKKNGFHSRPSLLVASIVQRYGGDVKLRVGSENFDASSVVQIEWAGGKIKREKITKVVFEGDTRALKDLEILANIDYGEEYMGKNKSWPQELSYLKN